jgi:hypothetical protein
VPDSFPDIDPCTVKLFADAGFMFRSNVAETTAAALTALSSGWGNTLTTAGGSPGLEEDSPPAPLHAKTPKVQQTAHSPLHLVFFKRHLPCGLSLVQGLGSDVQFHPLDGKNGKIKRLPRFRILG